jgi:hypothetical protein
LTISLPPLGSFRIYFGTLIPAQSREAAWEIPIQLGCHSGKGQNTDIVWIKQHVSMERRMPPIKALSLEAYGPIFEAVMLHVNNQEHQIRLYHLS